MSTAQKHGKNDRKRGTKHLPELCTNRDRPSPAQRKISGSGAVRVPGPDGISSVAFGAGNNAAGFNLPFRAPTTPKRRLQRNHSTSPTPSRRLDTGHHETDVESDLEEGQISEILPPLVFQETHLNETAKTAAAVNGNRTGISTHPNRGRTGRCSRRRCACSCRCCPLPPLLPPMLLPLTLLPLTLIPPPLLPPRCARCPAAAPAASTTTRRVTIEEIEDEDAGSGRQTPPLRLWEPVIVAVAAQSDIPPAAAAARPHDTPPVAIIDVDMPQATTTPADVIDVDAPMPAPEDTRARQAEQAIRRTGTRRTPPSSSQTRSKLWLTAQLQTAV
ncbi:hypothetical protein DFH06DRAFT_1345155 [Mycena polygramma]|nr:hypothetical protein DFH06DRAFT_1345155 [Mycena polygramma]